MLRSPFSLLPATLLVATLLLSACESSEDRAQRHFNSGVALIEAGEVSQALLEFRNALRLDPSINEARLHIARVQRDRGNLGEAYREFLQVVERTPDTLEARVALAQMALEEGDWEEGERHGRAAAALTSDDPAVTLIEAVLDYRAARLDRDHVGVEAPAELVRNLLAEEGDSAIGWRILIDHAFADGTEPERGLAQVEQALRERPDIYDFHMMRLRALSDLGRTDGIQPALEEMIERFADSEEPQRLLVQFLIDQEQLDEAEAFMRRRAEGETAADERRLQFLDFVLRSRGVEAALAETEGLVAEDPGNARLRGHGALLSFRAGDRDGAVAELRDILDGADGSGTHNDLRVLLARFHVGMGDTEAARARVAETLGFDGGHVEALKMHAGWLISDDRASDAISALRRAQSSAPRDPEIMVLMARAHHREGDRELAGERYAQAVEMSGDAPRESIIYAEFLLGENRLDSAEAVITSALRREPENLDLIRSMAEVQLRRGNWDRVQRMVWQLRAMEGDRPGLLANAIEADLLLRQGRRAETVDFLEGLVRDGSGQSGMVAALVQNQVMEGQVDGARELLDERLAEAPEDPVLRFLRAGVRVLSGELETAEAEYRQLLREFPAAEPPVRALYGLLHAQGRSEDADALIDELIAASPDAVMPRMLRAAHLERTWDIDGAIAIYEELYARDSNNLIFANNLASLISAHRSDAESLERAHTIARRLRGTDVPAFQDTYGWIQFRRGALDEALRYLEPAAAGLPEDPLVQFHLGMTYHALGRIQSARETLARAVALAGDSPLPQFDEARSLLADLDGG